MSTKLTHAIFLFLLASSLIVGLCVYPQLPGKIPSHWNIQGEVDGYMPKFWGVFLFPMILAFMYGLYLLIPMIDPLKKNLESSRKYFNSLMVMVAGFLSYIFFLTLAWTFFGWRFDMGAAIVPVLGVFIYCIGAMLPKLKRTFFVGIRTPWTLSSDLVWEKTHKLGGILFKVSGAIMFFSAFTRYVLFAGLGFLLLSVLALFVYSFLVFKNEGKSKNPPM